MKKLIYFLSNAFSKQSIFTLLTTYFQSFTLFFTLLKISCLCFLLTMQRYDDFKNAVSVFKLFCSKKRRLLTQIKQFVCEHSSFVHGHTPFSPQTCQFKLHEVGKLYKLLDTELFRTKREQ